MAQRLLPVADVAVDSWQGTPLWQRLDEDPFSDSDIINTVLANAFEYECEIQLSAALDPLQSTGHQVRLRAHRGVSGVAQQIRVRLVQGATLIAEWTQGLSDSFVTYTFALSGAEADAITNYSDLRLRLRRLTNGLTAQYINVSGVDLLIPDAGFAHLDIDPAGPGLVVVPAASGFYLTLSGPGYLRVAGVETPGSGALVLGAAGIEVHP